MIARKVIHAAWPHVPDPSPLRRLGAGPSGRAALRRILVVVATATTIALVTTSVALAGLTVGSLPSTGFTYTSVTDNTVNITGSGIHMKTTDSVNVKTTYTKVPVDSNFAFGWHYHNGPVIVTVTSGTLTYFDSSCHTFDLSAGHSYVESTGQVINAVVFATKNSGNATVEWFTTRLYPLGAIDPVLVTAPCTP